MVPNIEDLTPDAIIKLVEQFKSESRVSKLQEEHELLLVKEEIEGIDKQAEIKKLKQEISSLKRQKSGSSDETNLLIENFENQTILKERLEKLNQKRKTIQVEVYQALKDEYLTELNKLTQDLSVFLKKMEIARQQTQPLIQVLKFQIEELAVRRDVEELSEDDFNARDKELKSDLENKTNFLSALEFILKQVKK
ncbi:hypothetical protein CEE45_01310 [Candidatus Heimdallarchaeota archaeon B3_Heim]|nr:MAG: hypothetical protein CEE45_01310 [Candidatus Heimdallarchaeota archaeon B3_Heim]